MNFIHVLTSSKSPNTHSRAIYINSLLQSRIISEDDLEVLVSRDDYEPVYVMIRLAVNLSMLPNDILVQNGINLGENVFSLTFTLCANGRTNTSLQVPSKIEEFMGETRLRTHPFDKHSDMTKYVADIRSSIEVQIQDEQQHRQLISKRRKEFIQVLLKVMGRAALEFDSVQWSSVAFLLDCDGFHFMVQIQLPVQFPEKSPIYKFISLHHMSYGKPICRTFRDNSFSPNRDITEMAEYVTTFIRDRAKIFRDTVNR